MAYVNIGQILYPVGAVYASTQKTSPSSIFGGTWSQITNAALRGSTSIGYTGSDTCTLTVNQMPSHEHYSPSAYFVIHTDDNSMRRVGSPGTSAPGNSEWVNRIAESSALTPLPTAKQGGGQHIQLCNAPTTVLCGIAQLNKLGDVEWPTSTLHKSCIQWEQFIKAAQQLVHQVSLVEHGPCSMIIDSGYQVIHLDQLVEKHNTFYLLQKYLVTITLYQNLMKQLGTMGKTGFHNIAQDCLVALLRLWHGIPLLNTQEVLLPTIICHLIEPVTLGEEQPNIFYNSGDA